MTTEQVIGLLSAATDAGCLFVTFSGGEPLLRTDFSEIYAAARKMGLITSVFTNASLVDASHVALFCEYPPHRVEVSLYGATEQTYMRIAGVGGALASVRRGVEQLLDGGVRVSLKSVILKDNVDEIAAMARMATEYGLDYRVDPVVMPRIDGSQVPSAQRVDSRVAVGLETKLSDRRKQLERYIELEEAGLTAAPRASATKQYQCGAGVAGFHVDPQGHMRPCLRAREMAYNAVEIGFEESWRATTHAVQMATWSQESGCLECRDRFLCSYCAGLFELEGGNPSKPPEYICELGKARRSVVDAIGKESTNAR